MFFVQVVRLSTGLIQVVKTYVFNVFTNNSFFSWLTNYSQCRGQMFFNNSLVYVYFPQAKVNNAKHFAFL
jgi:hypothetical protein